MDSQLSLFDSAICTPPSILGVQGILGLNYYPGLLTSEEQSEILSEIDKRPWQHDLKRRVQHYGYKYDYRARRLAPSMYVGDLPKFAVQVGQKLVSSGIIAIVPDQVIVNEYVPGQGITPHIDCKPCFRNTIVTVSLVSVYTMDFYSTTAEDMRSHDLELGSALVFSNEARFEWKHGIKARKADKGRRRGRRVSLTFRNVILD